MAKGFKLRGVRVSLLADGRDAFANLSLMPLRERIETNLRSELRGEALTRDTSKSNNAALWDARS